MDASEPSDEAFESPIAGDGSHGDAADDVGDGADGDEAERPELLARTPPAMPAAYIPPASAQREACAADAAGSSAEPAVPSATASAVRSPPPSARAALTGDGLADAKVAAAAHHVVSALPPVAVSGAHDVSPTPNTCSPAVHSARAHDGCRYANGTFASRIPVALGSPRTPEPMRGTPLATRPEPRASGVQAGGVGCLLYTSPSPRD